MHIPVLLHALLDGLGPLQGKEIFDGTFGAGGYSRAFLEAGAAKVMACDQDGHVKSIAACLADEFSGRLEFYQRNFADVQEFIRGELDVMVVDLGVSSMQLDQAGRGFSFQKDGPLDMRMGQKGSSAADLVNHLPAEELADILYRFGEERASRRIAAAIVKRREQIPLERTLELAELVATVVRGRPGHHPATRTFQALRIAVNGEFDALQNFLIASQAKLRPGGILAVVSFHSLEDRLVKTFLTASASRQAGTSRYQPDVQRAEPAFELMSKAIKPKADELQANPRARSAILRLAKRTKSPCLVQPTPLHEALKGHWRVAA